MNLFKPGESDFRRRRCWSIRFLLAFLVLQFCDVTLSWANPRRINEEPSHQVWNFDIETAGTLPPNLVVGTLVDGRSAGNWQVIEMKQSLDLLQDLERREHQRIKKILQALVAPSPPHVIARLNHRAFEQDYHVVLVQGLTFADFALNVSLLPLAGKADMGGGLIWRARNAQNYYLTLGRSSV